MKFQLIFASKGSSAVSIDSLCGLRGLDFARNETGLELPIGVVGTANLSKNLYLDLSEGQARAAGVFNSSQEFRVAVNEGALNPFTKDTIEVRSCNKTGTISAVILRKEVDEDAVISAWIADGSPSEWFPCSDIAE